MTLPLPSKRDEKSFLPLSGLVSSRDDCGIRRNKGLKLAGSERK